MKILLMGGTGWVGHAIAMQLAAIGADVTILTRGLKKDFADEVKNIRMIQADKNDEAAMAEVLKTRYSHIIDTVPSEKAIQNVYRHAQGLRHYLHCSSTGGYAPLPFVPANETAPYRGFSAGWLTKRDNDALAMQLFMTDGFPVTILRPCYICGPGRFPLDNLGSRREAFIPDLMAEKVIDVPNDGTALLQPIHFQELARAFLLAIDHPLSIGQVYNICLDHAVPFNKYLELSAAALGKKPNINYMSVPDILAKYGSKVNKVNLEFVAEHMCFDISKARRDLDFHPRYTSEEAIEENVLWIVKNKL